MNILIPMAGAGSRFAKEGFERPKPLILVDGIPMIKRVVDNINLEGKYIFILQKEHLEKYPYFEKELRDLKPDVEIVLTDGLTEGAACTALLAEEFIDNDQELLICNSDQWIDWDGNHFVNFVRKQECDGAIPYFLSDSPKYSYAKINYNTKNVTQVAEKQVISNLATVGVYYWKTGSSYVENAKSMIRKNVRFNNEFYVCPVYNELIHVENGKVIPYPVYEWRGMGTPEELEDFLILLEKDKENN